MALTQTHSQRLDEIARRDPHLQPLTRLLDASLAAAADPVWQATTTDLADSAAARLHAGEPVLHYAILSVPRVPAQALYAQLSDLAGAQARGSSPAIPHEAPEASADQPDPSITSGTLRLEALRSALTLDDAEPGPLGTVLQLTLLPLLQAAARTCAAAVEDAAWSSGCCPVCAAWPALAESRGLDRTRVLRCGRCGAGWSLPWQLCPFCASDDHRELGYLYDQDAGEARRVFTCQRCHGALKTLATITALDPLLVTVEDLATLPLDLAAVDAGFQRPTERAFPLDSQLRWHEENRAALA